MAAMESSYENAHYLPIYCNLQDRKVVIVGGGRVAGRKVRSLLPSGAKITVISPEVTHDLACLIKHNNIRHLKRSFSTGDLRDAWLVIAATDDAKVQEQVFSEAERLGCLCNVVDRPEKCSFIVPSVVKRGALTMAVSTGGQSPGLARALRKRLEEEFPEEWAPYVELAGRLRRLILSSKDPERIQRGLERLVCFRCIRWIQEKEWEKLVEWAIDIGGKEAEILAKEAISSWTDSFSN